MPVLMIVMVEPGMVVVPMLALSVGDRHDLTSPRAKRELRQQHHACHGLGR